MQNCNGLATLAPTEFDWSRCAVIARKWKCLQPVRAICEAQSIEVQLASDELPNLWQTRETQNLLEMIFRSDKETVSSTEITTWLDRQPDNIWRDLLRETIDEYHLETDGRGNPIKFFVEWLAEALKEFRRSQQELLLLTAHSAKGLEFDHVVLLDGEWESRGKPTDEERRLYYVAMTRARKTLTLMHIGTDNRFCTELSAKRPTLNRSAIELDKPTPEMYYQYQQLTLKDVDLSFAGRFPARDPIHQTISKLQSGDPLVAKATDSDGDNGIRTFSSDGSQEVVRLAKRYTWRKGMRLREASVFAVMRRKKEWSRTRLPIHPPQRPMGSGNPKICFRTDQLTNSITSRLATIVNLAGSICDADYPGDLNVREVIFQFARTGRIE